MKIFECSPNAIWPELMRDVAAEITASGYAVVQAWNMESATFLKIATHLGAVQSHARADEYGITGEGAPVSREWEVFKTEYLGTSNADFLPHTDGSFMAGLVYDGEHYVRLQPPKMVLFQCTQKAEQGGGNFLIDGQRVFDDLLRHDRQKVATLMTNGCVAYCRDDLIALDCAVFERMTDHSIRLRYRYDCAPYIAEWALEEFRHLHVSYHTNSEYQLSVSLEPNQILAVDNYRMLHARTAFANSSAKARKLRRVWLAPDNMFRYRHAQASEPDKRALKPFQNYRILTDTRQYGEYPLSLGIKCPADVI